MVNFDGGLGAFVVVLYVAVEFRRSNWTVELPSIKVLFGVPTV